MRTGLLALTLLGTILGAFRPCFAQSEAERREDFFTHNKAIKTANEERERGLTEYLEAQAAWEDQRKKDLENHLKRRKAESHIEGDQSYIEDLAEKSRYRHQREEDRLLYVEHKSYLRPKTPKEKEAEQLFAMQELGLPTLRPRYDVPKRVLFGAHPLWAGTKNTGGNSPTSNAPAFNNGPGVPNFPPPPAFEDFGENGGGYIPPPPPPPEGFENPQEGFVPPPPPPMPFPEDGNGGYFPPPPPPGYGDPQY